MNMVHVDDVGSSGTGRMIVPAKIVSPLDKKEVEGQIIQHNDTAGYVHDIVLGCRIIKVNGSMLGLHIFH